MIDAHVYKLTPVRGVSFRNLFPDILTLTAGLGFARKGTTCSMKSYRLSELSPPEVESLKARPRIDFSSIFSTVSLSFGRKS